MAETEHDFLHFTNSDKNSSNHQSNESDDFVQLDPYQVQEHGGGDDDLLANKHEFNNMAAGGLNSTDRPLVTFDEALPTAPSAPPSLSPVHESAPFEESAAAAEHDNYAPPAYTSAKKDSPPEDLDFLVGDSTKISPSDFKYAAGDFEQKDKEQPAEKNARLKSADDITRAAEPDSHFNGDEDDDDEHQGNVVDEPISRVDKMDSLLTASPIREGPPAPIASGYTEIGGGGGGGCASCPFRAWLNPQNLDPRVVDLIYWRDPKKTGVVFGGILVVLLSLTYFSLISVIAYLSLAVLAGTISFRIYKNIMAAVQKSNEGHPFKLYLEHDLAVSGDQIHSVVETVVTHFNAVVHELRRLILVEDLIDSIKFGIMLWCLTYVGAWFNGMTLLILAFVGVFTLPKVYEQNKTQIDHYVGLVNAQVNDIMSKVKAKVPLGKKQQ